MFMIPPTQRRLSVSGSATAPDHVQVMSTKVGCYDGWFDAEYGWDFGDIIMSIVLMTNDGAGA